MTVIETAIAMKELTFCDWVILLDLIDDQLKAPYGLGTLKRLTKINKRREVLSNLKEKLLVELDTIEFLDMNELAEKGINLESLAS